MATGSEIVAWKKACEEQIPYEVTSCPVCEWPIEKHPETGALHCEFCGWIYGIKRRYGKLSQ